MAQFLQFAVIALMAVVLTAEPHHGSEQGSEDSRMARMGWGGQQQGGRQGAQGRSNDQGWGQMGMNNQGGYQGAQGRNGQGWGQQGRNQDWQQGSNGRQGADSRYTANLFNDDEVYGYEAKYPNGEALYVNYRNSEARARRGPGFARSNSISSRMNGGSSGHQQDSQQENGYRQQRSGMTMDTMMMAPSW